MLEGCQESFPGFGCDPTNDKVVQKMEKNKHFVNRTNHNTLFQPDFFSANASSVLLYRQLKQCWLTLSVIKWRAARFAADEAPMWLKQHKHTHTHTLHPASLITYLIIILCTYKLQHKQNKLCDTNHYINTTISLIFFIFVDARVQTHDPITFLSLFNFSHIFGS